jgi:hypothetical protein
MCTCPAGIQGAFCKHQYAVNSKFKISFVNPPEILNAGKISLSRIVLAQDSIP